MSVAARPRRAPMWLSVLFGTSSAGVAINVALAAVRIVLAWIFIYYGGAKLFGWFGGGGPHGIHATATYFSHAAHLHPGTFFAVLGGVTEFGGGIAMALGLLSRLAGLALFADMVIAMITVTWATGINSTSSPPGYQLNIAVAVLALVIALVGGGRYSLDAILARRLPSRKNDSSTGALLGAAEDSNQRGHV